MEPQSRKVGPMDETQLTALVDAEVQGSMGYAGKLAEQRRQSLEYYFGRPTGALAPSEVEGRSKVVSPDVANAVEWAMPSLMRIFTSGEDIARYDARKPQDEAKAMQATEYANWLLWSQNNGFRVVYCWLKDALLSKNGYVQVYTEDKKEVVRQSYAEQSLEQVHMLMQPEVEGEEITITSKKEEIDPAFAAQMPAMQQQLQQATQQYQQAQSQLQQAIQAAQQGNQQAAQAAQQLQQQVQSMGQQLAQAQHQYDNPPKVYSFDMKRVRVQRKTLVENIPPEEMLISRKAKSLEDTPFIGRLVRKRIGDLIAMGFDEEVCVSLTDDTNWSGHNAEGIMRRIYDDEATAYFDDGGTNDPMARYVWLIDGYVQCDYDGDGILEWRRVFKAGTVILKNEVVEGHPYADMCPILMPHRQPGMSLADITMDFQTIKTQLLRQYLDALYIGNTPRYEVVDGQVNLDDMLTGRVGGLVRVKQPGQIAPLQTQDVSQSAQAGLEYFSQLTDERTGITKYNQGLDANTLNSTATGIDLIQQASMQRLELMARCMAETGFRRLFQLLLKEATTHQNRRQTVKLTGGWVDIDPREWRNGFDLTIDVGLGTGNAEAKARQLMNMVSLQGQMQQVGIVTPQNIYYAASKIPQALGMKDSDKFFTDPSKTQIQQPPNPEVVKAQANMQGIQAKGQIDMQLKNMELSHSAQIEQAKMQQTAQIEAMKVQMQAHADALSRQHEAQLDQMRAHMQAQVDDNKQRAQAEQTSLQLHQEAQLRTMEAQFNERAQQSEQAFNQWKAQLDNETKVLVAQITAAAATQKAQQATESGDADAAKEDQEPKVDVAGALQAALTGFTQALDKMSQPKTVIRGDDGRIIGTK